MSVNRQELIELKKFSAEIRCETLKMLKHVGYGHIGGALSMVEFWSVLYKKHLVHDPKNPTWNERDYVILSKGHSAPSWYAALACRGYFDKKVLKTLNEGGTMLPSHPDRLKIPGVDMSTGSLGQGISVAAGLGYALKLENKNQYVYVVLGDGELNEGQCWEAFQFIAHYKLNNVIVVIDENKKQLDGFTRDVINTFNLAKKMESFGFHTQYVKGNDEKEISDAIERSKSVTDQAVCIILDTIKGQGVKHFEDMLNNHSVNFNEEDNRMIEKAIESLESRYSEWGVNR